MELTASPEGAALLLSMRLAAARLTRSIIATLKTTISALRRSRKKQRPLAAIANLPPAARILLILPIFLFPTLLYILLAAANTFSAPTASPDIFASLLSVTARIATPPDTSLHHLPPGFIPAPRRSTQSVFGSVPSIPVQDPVIRLVFACDREDPCCDLTYAHSLRAALRQTLTPNEVTFIHGCVSGSDATERADQLTASARHLVADDLSEKIYEKPVKSSDDYIRFVACNATSGSSVDMETCILRFLASPQHRPTVKPGSYVMIATPSTVLEPTAIETLWLHLFTRPMLRVARPLAYHDTSLRRAIVTADPTQANVSLPNRNVNDDSPVHTLPLMVADGQFSLHSPPKSVFPEELWGMLARVMSSARVVRTPLYTLVDSTDESRREGDTDPRPTQPTLALNRKVLTKDKLPAHLWSEHALYRWSARSEVRETYAVPLDSDDEKNGFDFWGMPYRRIMTSSETSKNPHVFFVMPWMQMGGSEKCILDVAERLVSMKWSITFIFTMPFWHEDPLGELALKHEWIDKALAITPDVFDLVSVAPNDKFTKVLRYFLESRSPDYIFTGNARVVYEHTKFIKRVLPKVVIADYNHMVHMNWEVVPGKGGGMPRYGAEFTEHIDLHLTASDNVTASIKSWMPSGLRSSHPEKVKTCYIGTDPSALHTNEAKAVARTQLRQELRIAVDKTVILFAGRFVSDKGIDTMSLVVKAVAEDPDLSKRLSFVFVGSGDQKSLLESTFKEIKTSDLQMILRPPAVGLAELRNYYAMSDIFLLPSTNEGIALVLYEAMASGLLVMGTDVGGQKELIRTNTGILLPNLNDPPASASFIVRQLQAYTKFTPMFKEIQEVGSKSVKTKFTTEKFCDCVIDNMKRVKAELDKSSQPRVAQEKAIEATRMEMADVMRGERVHGLWNQRQVDRSIEGRVTVGIKTYVCDSSIVRQVVGLVRSIRVNYPRVRIILANDGPTSVKDLPLMHEDPLTEEVMLPADSGISVGRNVMVNMTQTEFFVLLDDDHVFDEDTDLNIAVRGVANHNFDVVGIRVRNLPGIEELERISIFIPRYVAKVTKFENREITLCVWNENNGPGVQSMRVPIRVDVLHNALIAKTDTLRAHAWRNILKVNEHMTFFLDLRRAGVRVGYLPSVFVHHRARRYSACYRVVRFREDKYEQLLEYKDSYLWDVPCGDDFPSVVTKHIETTKELA